MTGEDAFNIFYFLIIWAQPAAWMWFIGVKAPALDALRFTLPVYAAATTLTLTLPQFTAIYTDYPPIYLFAFYSLMGTLFATALSYGYGWGFSKSLGVGALTAFAGSYLWEIPYLIINAPRTGLADWALHLYGLLITWALTAYVGWGSPGKTLVLLAASLTVSLACMWISPVGAGVADAATWNAPLYMLNRGFASIIVFTLLKKEILR